MTNIFVSQIILHFGYARVFMFSSVLLGTSTVLLMTIIRVFNFSYTVGTPNKGQLIFRENGSNKGNLGIPLFAIFTK